VNEMSEQVRGIIFVLLVLIIIFVWSHFYNPPVPPAQKQTANTSQIATHQNGQSAAAKSSSSIAALPPVDNSAIQAPNQKQIQVESPLYSVQFTNRGGVVLSWKLKKYFDDQKTPQPLDIVNAASSEQLGWPFSILLNDPTLQQEANTALYQVTPDTETINAPGEIRFHWSNGHLDITKSITFGSSYGVSIDVAATLDGRPIPCGLAWRGGFGDKAVARATQLTTVFYKSNGKLNLLQYKKLGVSNNQSQPQEQAGPMEFLGIEDQFFTATFLPDNSDLTMWHWTQYHNISNNSEPIAEMAAGTASAEPLHMHAFIGPKDLALLEKQQPNLEELVNFGWTGVIAKPLLFILQLLHRYISNWGWTIVVLTLVINFAVFPLKMKSQRSMQKMARVGPEIRTIQDRYKKYSMNDPRKRKMNEEVMAVYQREGINPVGQCLPMLFQMPVWWALWRVLNGAIELRHAPWIGWVHDLSASDPYYILPGLMAVTMFIMTRMTPQTAAVDPAQQRMTQLMPLMFAAFFFRLSSGLNLYMFTSNLVGLAQQYYLNRSQPLPSRSKFKKKKNDEA
jgi:YidC/Oxa1 family membrane protein insertase